MKALKKVKPVCVFEARHRVIGLGQGILGMKSGKRSILQKFVLIL